MESRPASTFVISLTPFAADGSLDEEGLRAHLCRLLASGIGVYVGGSGSGEGYVRSAPERRRVLEIASEVLSEQVPVRAMGVEPRSAREMIAYAEQVAAAGLDAMQVYSLDQGHGYRPRPEELDGYLWRCSMRCRFRLFSRRTRRWATTSRPSWCRSSSKRIHT